MTKRFVSVDQALASLTKHITPLDSEKVTLAEACGRVLRQPVFSDRDMPPFDRVMMDGVAIRHKRSVSGWRIQGIQYAGDEPLKVVDSGTCLEIMTGSVLPLGTDTIIPVEDYHVKNGEVSLPEGVKIKHGQYVHRRGSVGCMGDCLIAPPVVLDGRTLALCASVGLMNLQVTRKPKVAFISTGSELVDPTCNPEPSQIRLTNDRLVAAELHKLGIPLNQNHHLPDDRELILNLLNQLKKDHDLIVLSGGVSKGKADFIPICVWEAGFEVMFHDVQQKPGGPVLAAKHPSGTVLLAMPGNPISSLVCTRLYLRVILSIVYGWPVHMRKIKVKGKVDCIENKTRLLPGTLLEHKNAGTVGKIVYSDTSDDMLNVLNSDGLVRIPACENQSSSTNGIFEYFDWAL
jgi:molybdopterin molybdotransferase